MFCGALNECQVIESGDCLLRCIGSKKKPHHRCIDGLLEEDILGSKVKGLVEALHKVLQGGREP